MENKMDGKYFVLGIVLAAIIVVGGLIYMNQAPYNMQKTITATGNSEIKSDPDLVVVYFQAKATKSTAEDARAEVSKVSQALVSSVSSIVDSKDIETEQYSIYEEYDYSGGTQRFKGYTASQQIKVSSTEFDKAGQIVDKGVKAGALVNYINFEFTPERQNQLKADALKSASADAKIKAEAIAAGLGAKLGKIVSVQTSDYYYRPYNLYSAGASEKSAVDVASNITPSTLDTTATVTVVYSIR